MQRCIFYYFDLFFSSDTLGICPDEDINTIVERKTRVNAVIGEEQNHREADYGEPSTSLEIDFADEAHRFLNISYEVNSLVTNRRWLSYNKATQSLHCSVCVAFGMERVLKPVFF